jgi:hypothetical protein
MWWVPVLVIGINGAEPVSLEHNSYYFTEEQCMARAEVLANLYIVGQVQSGNTVDEALYHCKPVAEVS